MNFLIDGRLISQKPTGISRYTLELIDSYVERYGSNNVTILLNENVDLQCPKVFTKLKPYNLFHFLLFPFFINLSKYDFFHCPFYVGPFLKLSRNVKIILTVHDLMFLVVPGFFSSINIINSLGKLYYWVMVKLSLKVSDILISVSKTTQTDVIKIFNKNSLIIPEGINLQTKIIHTYANISKHILKEDYFLYVGNNRPHKNVDFLLNVYAKYIGSCKLIIVGHTNKSMKENRNIIYLNNVNDAELIDLYKNCKAFILPSKYEGFGLPILEAISNGTIVFSSNYGALKEFPFHSVYYFNPNNFNELLDLLINVENYKFHSKDFELLRSYDWKRNFISFHNYVEKQFN